MSDYIIPVMFTYPSGQWAGIDDLIAAGVGFVTGLVGQYISDVISNYLVNGFSLNILIPSSSWETYVGASIGGLIGGVAFLYSGPVGSGAVTGFATTFIGQGLESITGKNKRSLKSILINSGIDGLAGAITGKAFSGINRINSGRNSFSAVFKSGLTKMHKGTAQRMSKIVLTKGFTQMLISSSGLDIYYGFKQFMQRVSYQGVYKIDLMSITSY